MYIVTWWYSSEHAQLTSHNAWITNIATGTMAMTIGIHLYSNSNCNSGPLRPFPHECKNAPLFRERCDLYKSSSYNHHTGNIKVQRRPLSLDGGKRIMIRLDLLSAMRSDAKCELESRCFNGLLENGVTAG